MRRCAFPLLLLAAACGGAESSSPDTVALSDSAIAALPELAVVSGSLVCTATGGEGCPRRSPLANRLDDDRIALWEPGFRAHVFGPGDTVGAPIGAPTIRQYGHAVAITQVGAGRYRMIVIGQGWRALEVNGAGEMLSVDTLPDPGPLTALGYAGKHLIRQRMHGWLDSAGGRLTVTLLEQLTDTVGTDLLNAPLPWLNGGTVDGPPVPPLMAATPAWALGSDAELIWSPGDRLTVERRSRSGEVRWRIEGPPGPRITEAEFAAREATVRQAAAMMPYTEEDYAQMRAKADSLHAAVTGLIVTPTGEVFLARTAFPDRDSIEFLRLDAAGTPNGRFTLDKRFRVLLAERDSLLVHQPTEGEPWQVRWMRLQ